MYRNSFFSIQTRKNLLARLVAFLLLTFSLNTMATAASSVTSSLRRTIVWFRNDLRIHDNPVLSAASRHIAATGGEHICLYCFDPRHFSPSPHGSIKTGVYRAKYLLESVDNLKKNLRAIGSDLVISMGKPEDVIPTFVTLNSEIFVHGEVTSEELDVEIKVERALKPSKSKLNRIFGGNMLYHVEDFPYAANLRDMPDTFTPVKEKLEKRCTVRPLLPSVTSSSLCNSAAMSLDATHRDRSVPTLPELGFDENTIAKATTELDPRGVMAFTGGEDAALQRMQTWMFDEDNLKEYFDVRNGMLGSSYSSKFSPALAHGCLSARKIYYEVKRYETERRISNKSTYWLIFELIWRDFYRALCAKYGNRVFFEGGVTNKEVTWSLDADMIRRWKEGRTGWPLIDANMRELAATGWMSNRGRQNVASFLVLDCQVDWRVGADHFESLLLDHDVCSNYGNWNAAAGLTGGRVNKFNISKQSRDYDADGNYIRHWLPELRNVPAPMIFEPWKLSKADQERYQVKVGNGEDCTYPSPLENDSNSGNYNNHSGNRNQNQYSGKEGGGKGGYQRGGQGRTWSSVAKKGRVQHF